MLSYIYEVALVILFFASFGVILVIALLLTIYEIPNRKNKKITEIEDNKKVLM